MEEDGRLGNLLMEMATLLLLGEHANVTVSLLPQVHPYWHSISAFFFYETDLWHGKMAPRRCSYASQVLWVVERTSEKVAAQCIVH